MIKSFFFQFLSISNFFTNIYILFLLLFFNFYEEAGEGFVLVSFINIFTYGLSGNIRNVYLGSCNISQIEKFILFRLKVAILGILFSFLFCIFVIKTQNLFLQFCIIFLTASNWILELPIAKSEKTNFIKPLHVFNSIIIIVLSPILIKFGFIKHLAFLIILICLINIFNYKILLKNLNFSKNLNINLLFNLAHVSTMFRTLSNFAWRFSLILFIGKSHSSIIFMAFSLGSFFGTLFDISYGAFLMKKIKNQNLLINFMFIFYFIFVLVFLVMFYKLSNLDLEKYKILKSTTLYSLVGAYFLIFSLKKRQELFEKKRMINTCYKFDMLSYTFNLLIIPMLFILNPNYIVFAYLLSSMFLFLIYKIFLNRYDIQISQ